MARLDEGQLVQSVAVSALELTGTERDFDPIRRRAERARFVLLGEASHGTHEFYRLRAQITKSLIREQGFTAVAVEGDWPDCRRVSTTSHMVLASVSMVRPRGSLRSGSRLPGRSDHAARRDAAPAERIDPGAGGERARQPLLRGAPTGAARCDRHLDVTRAVEPLERFAMWERGEVPETYPSGI